MKEDVRPIHSSGWYESLAAVSAGPAMRTPCRLALMKEQTLKTRLSPPSFDTPGQVVVCWNAGAVEKGPA